MKNILLISDLRYSEINNGGAESNNHELIKILAPHHKVGFITTFDFNKNFNSLQNIDLFILSNFYFISDEAKQFLYNKKYIITEHDYKFLQSRNPCIYQNFEAPKTDLIHQELYQKSIFTLVQSDFQKQIFQKNLSDVTIVNFSGNLWPVETLDLIEALSYKPKNGKTCILSSDDYGIKGVDRSIDFCNKTFLKYDLIPKLSHHEFLKFISDYSTYVFFPRSPETLSRVTIEARLMNLSVITSQYTSAVHEEFYKLENKEILKYLKNKRIEILDLIQKIL